MNAHDDPRFDALECDENLATPGIAPGRRPDDRPREPIPDSAIFAEADFQSFDCAAADPPSAEGRTIGLTDDDLVEIIVEALKSVWPDSCKRVGRANLQDLAEGVEFEPTERAAAMDFTSQLNFLARGVDIANHGLAIYLHLKDRHRQSPMPEYVIAEAKKTLSRPPEVAQDSVDALLNAVCRLAADRGA